MGTNEETGQTMKPEYTNEFEKPVYKVNNLHMKTHSGNNQFGEKTYELQLNDQYFVITEHQLEALDTITRLPDNISISMG